MAYLTDRALASGVTLSDLLHIVITSDVSQNPDGSSYKATIQQVGDALSGSSFNTYVFSGNADVATSTLTFLNNDGGTFTVTNSAALFSDNDINVTGGTYNPSNGCVTFITNSGTTFDVCGFLTGFTDTNFANTNLTFDGNRSHDTNGFNYQLTSDGGVFGEGWQTLSQFDSSIGWGNNYIYTNSDSIRLYTNSGTSATERIRIQDNNGYVGIGTSTPSEKLDVDGNTKISGSLNIGNILGNTPIGNLGFDSSGNVVSGSTFTGNTSGDCITDLYVSKIHSCSPLNINPNDEGNVYFGSTSGVTIDLTNNRVGIGTTTPAVPLQVRGTAIPSTNENLAYFTVSDAPGAYFGIGNGTTLDGTFQPKLFGRQSSLSNGTAVTFGGVIDSTQDSGSSTVVNFQAHLDTLTPVVTRPIFQWKNWSNNLMTMDADGNLGIGTASPSETLDVNGNTKISGSLNIGTILSGTPLINLGLDSSGNVVTGTTGGGTFTGNTSGDCITDLYVSKIHSCSPLNINPNDEGDVYIGSNSGFTYDLTNSSQLIKGNVFVQSDSLSLSSAISQAQSTGLKGSIKYFSHTGITIDNLFNPNVSGAAKMQIGDNIGTNKDIEIGYYGSSYIRNGTPTTGVNFWQNKVVVKNGSSTNGVVYSNNSNKSTYWENQENCRMILTTDGKLGIGLNPNGTEEPTEKLHIEGGDILVKNTSGKFFTDIQNSVGPLVLISGGTSDLPRFGVITPSSDSITMGVRGGSDVSYPGYGNQGDSFIYSSNQNNGINIISSQGTGTDDYIRFYAGQNANGTTPDLYIQGSGSTRGNIGINNDSPTSKLDIVGANGYEQLRLRNSYTPSSSGDTNGNIGDIAWDTTYLYIKTGTGWGRISLDYGF